MIRVGKNEDAKQIAKLKISNYRKTYKNIFPKKFLDNMSIDEEIEKYIKRFRRKKCISIL